MKIDRDTVTQWLERERRSQKWLAKQCGVTDQAVSNWLREKNPRAISDKGKIIIRGLMEEDAAREQSKPAHHIVLDFNDSDFEAIEKAALRENETVRQWAKRTLNGIASVSAEDLVADLRRGNDFQSTSTDPIARHLNEATQGLQDRGSFVPLEMRDGK